MSGSPRSFLRVVPLAAVTAVVTLLACTDTQLTGPAEVSVSYAKGGGGPKVTGANPNSAPPDTTLVVRVTGSGFLNTPAVTFLLGGESTPDIVTDSFTVVDDENIDANITITPDAEIGLYDIEVATAGRGKNGIGTELFSVQQPGGGINELPLQVTFNDASGLTNDDGGLYVHDLDRVRAVLRGNGNLNFDAANFKGKKKDRCVTVTVTDVTSETVLFGPQCVHLQLNTNARFDDDVVLRQMLVGETGTTTGAAGWELDRVVHKVRYGRHCGSDLSEVLTLPPTKITATRNSDAEWHLTGSPALYCVGGSEVSSDAQVDFDVILEAN